MCINCQTPKIICCPLNRFLVKLQLFFMADWEPLSFRDSSEAVRKANYNLDHVSVGHDIETAYLMKEASEVIGHHQNKQTSIIYLCM